jgi:hypothetical protein
VFKQWSYNDTIPPTITGGKTTKSKTFLMVYWLKDRLVEIFLV